MAAAWIRWTHWAALALWALALLAICIRGAGGAHDRRLYRLVANPAAFLTFLSLVALLHQTPQHLLQRPTQAGILALLGLMGLDHLCERGVAGRLTAGGVVLAAAAVATTGALGWAAGPA